MWKPTGIILVIYFLAGLTVGAARAGEAEDKAMLEALQSGAPASADGQEKQDVSGILARRQLPSPNVGTVPFRDGVEWYLPANALCALIKSVSEMDVFVINPGVANPGQWSRVAFKGGSELGVLNLTTWVKSGSGQSYCVAFTANDAGAIKESEVISAYATLLGFLAGMK